MTPMRKKLKHGMERMYAKGCRCPKCTVGHRAAAKSFRKNNGILGGVGPGHDGTPEWTQYDLDLLLEPATKARLHPDVLYDILLS
jgi:hypothetical protein